jgi:5'-nucleotidase
MSNRLEMLIDMDGIVTDFSGPFLRHHNDRTGEKLVINDQTEFNIFKHTYEHILPEFEAMVMRPGFFLELEPLPGAIEALRELNEIVDVYIGTSPPRKAINGATEKYLWWQKNAPFIDIRRIGCMDFKHMVDVDIFLDDNGPNLIRRVAAKPNTDVLTIDYAYNRDLPDHVQSRVKRFNGCADTSRAWKDIVGYVKWLAESIPY